MSLIPNVLYFKFDKGYPEIVPPMAVGAVKYSRFEAPPPAGSQVDGEMPLERIEAAARMGGSHASVSDKWVLQLCREVRRLRSLPLSEAMAPAGDLRKLLREARDNAIASSGETGISDDRREYRTGLAKRLDAAMAALVPDGPAFVFARDSQGRAYGINRYGVDAEYFRKELLRLTDSLNDRPAEELAQYLLTLSRAAQPAPGGAEIREAVEKEVASAFERGEQFAKDEDLSDNWAKAAKDIITNRIVSILVAQPAPGGQGAETLEPPVMVWEMADAVFRVIQYYDERKIEARAPGGARRMEELREVYYRARPPKASSEPPPPVSEGPRPLEAALDAVAAKLSAMPHAEFLALLEAHKNGDIAQALAYAMDPSPGVSEGPKAAPKEKLDVAKKAGKISGIAHGLAWSLRNDKDYPLADTLAHLAEIETTAKSIYGRAPESQGQEGAQ